MNTLRASAVVVSLLALSVASPTLTAKDKTPATITVAFGSGMNFNQPGNTLNHHVIPQEFKVRITRATKLNGEVVVVPATVNFNVSGFHWLWVYQAGVSLEEVSSQIPPAPATFVNYEVVANGVSNVFAKGVFPGNPPAFTNAATFPLGATQNRTESVGFTAPGRYLIMCNVRGHFLDGMYAWVTVVDDEDEN